MPDTSVFDLDWVAAHCESFAAERWVRMEGVSPEAVDFLVHACYLRRYLSAGMRILQVGSGAKRFSPVLEALGCRVVGTSPSPAELQAEEPGREARPPRSPPKTTPPGEAEDFHRIRSESADGVVAFGGPRCQQLDRAWVFLAECVRICRPGGPILASFLSPWGTLRRYLEGALTWDGEGTGHGFGPGAKGGASWHEVGSRCDLVRASDLRTLAREVGLEVQALSASNALSVGWSDFLSEAGGASVNRLELLRLELAASREDEALDMGTHIILVGRRPTAVTPPSGSPRGSPWSHRPPGSRWPGRPR